jgi:putative hydroxymethylpyrimidine transport system ATP-binding protein
MLKINNASLSYKNQILFTDLNLTIPEAEWVAILGKSGIGKTSLLRMIAGLTQNFPEPDTCVGGNICWQGQEDLHTQITYMAQQDGLLPWLSIIDNVVISQSLQGNKVNRESATSYLNQVGLSAHFQKKPKMLSGGMRQRVALARTLMQDKPIVLMDEPFSALDALTRLEMQNLFIDVLRSQKKTVVMVTHDPWEALRLADRVLVLSGMPAQFSYTLTLPKNTKLRPLTTELLKNYDEILAALGKGA